MTKNMMKSPYSKALKYLSSVAISLAMLASGCSSDESEPTAIDPDALRQTAEVPVKLTFGETWDFDDETRAAPPSVGNTADNTNSFEDIANVNTVRMIAFRRKSDEPNSAFVHDSKNDKILNVTKYQQGDHKHNIAEGTLTKTYGYQYRVIAIAYSSNKDTTFPSESGALDGESDWFELVGDTYDSFMLRLKPTDCSRWSNFNTCSGVINNMDNISNQILQTPQIFYGVLNSERSDSDIIDYAEEDEQGELKSDYGLRGVLHRGVAKVDISIAPINTDKNFWEHSTGNILWITILAKTPNTQTNLTCYDDFHWASSEITGGFIPLAYIPIIENSKEPVSTTLWFLPCKTELGVRIKYKNFFSVEYFHNSNFTAEDIEDHGNNGTGIVSPTVIDNIFYFRRNHKYKLKVSNLDNVLKRNL
ncbi:MAG: hypothetical protein NC548_40285 [Lachnospiraceae bacterium]|nr:hypothetical protein [Lachnospiraceae bacterium]